MALPVPKRRTAPQSGLGLPRNPFARATGGAAQVAEAAKADTAAPQAPGPVSLPAVPRNGVAASRRPAVSADPSTGVLIPQGTVLPSAGANTAEAYVDMDTTIPAGPASKYSTSVGYPSSHA